MNNEYEVNTFFDKATAKCGLIREQYIEKNVPTDFNNIVIMPFWGDYKSQFVMSTLLLKRYINNVKKPRYFIVCSWEGFGGLYPYVNEYWSLPLDEQTRPNFIGSNIQYARTEKCNIDIQKYFSRNEIINGEELYAQYFHNGFTEKYFKDYEDILHSLPLIPASSIDFNRRMANKPGIKVVIHPITYAKVWQRGEEKLIPIDSKFWCRVIELLLENGIIPVVWQSPLTYDVSPSFGESCIYIDDNNILKTLSNMRFTGCVLDIFSGISNLAIIARCPYIICDERQRYFSCQDFVIDDMCGDKIPHAYCYLFQTLLANNWDVAIKPCVNKILDFVPKLDRLNWSDTNNYDDILSYSKVRDRKLRQLGTQPIKIRKL